MTVGVWVWEERKAGGRSGSSEGRTLRTRLSTSVRGRRGCTRGPLAQHGLSATDSLRQAPSKVSRVFAQVCAAFRRRDRERNQRGWGPRKRHGEQ